MRVRVGGVGGMRPRVPSTPPTPRVDPTSAHLLHACMHACVRACRRAGAGRGGRGPRARPGRGSLCLGEGAGGAAAAVGGSALSLLGGGGAEAGGEGLPHGRVRAHLQVSLCCVCCVCYVVLCGESSPGEPPLLVAAPHRRARALAQVCNMLARVARVGSFGSPALDPDQRLRS